MTIQIGSLVGVPVELNETTRTYIWKDMEYTLHDVRELVVRESGSHRVKTADGKLYYISAGWRAIVIEDEKKDWTV